MRWRGGSDGGLADLSGGNVTKGGGMRFAFPPYACSADMSGDCETKGGGWRWAYPPYAC
jgi:hypothetical protein